MQAEKNESFNVLSKGFSPQPKAHTTGQQRSNVFNVHQSLLIRANPSQSVQNPYSIYMVIA